MLVKNLLAVASLISTVIASEGTGLIIYHKADLSVTACKTLFKKVLYFEETDAKAFCNVDNQPALGSMAHCLKLSPHPKAIETFLKDCSSFGLTEKDFNQAYDNATDYLVSNFTADPDFNATQIYTKPIGLKKAKVDAGYRSAVDRFYNYNWSTWFGTALIGYWFFIVLVAGFCNLLYFIAPAFVKSLNYGFINFFRKYISLPATGRSKHLEHKSFLRIFQWIAPTRLETILICGWLIMALVFQIVHINFIQPDLFWIDRGTGVGRKLADRTGVISLFLMPELILFAGRNNFLQWISGWSYSRFSLLHRWISRACTILVIIHAVGMTYNGKGLGKYETRNAKPYVQWGFVATICACIMCFQSLLVFRKKNYELFLLIHIIMAIFFVVGVWHHAGSADQGYIQWSYASVAIWAFDRFVRILRLISFGVKKANVTLIADETLKVIVPKPSHWKSFPGCHAFIHFLKPTCFWQSHPFTIVNSHLEDNTIIFYLKVKGGMTHGLYQYLSNQPDNKAMINVMIEGPYGNRLPTRKFDTNILLAGGNGIPGLYSEISDLSKTNSHTKLYWIIRHYKSIEWFYDELKALENLNVETIIYVTQPHVGLDGPIGGFATGPIGGGEVDADDIDEVKNEKSDASASEDDDLSNDHILQLKQNLNHIEFREGRPLVDDLVKSEISQANSSIAFVTCAHANLVDSTRKSIANNLSTEKRVELFESNQAW